VRNIPQERLQQFLGTLPTLPLLAVETAAGGADLFVGEQERLWATIPDASTWEDLSDLLSFVPVLAAEYERSCAQLEAARRHLTHEQRREIDAIGDRDVEALEIMAAIHGLVSSVRELPADAPIKLKVDDGDHER
jgi:hypothetical protein